MRRWQLVIDVTGSEEGIYAFIYCTKWKSGQVSKRTDGQTLKDSATQLLTKYKSGALVTQYKSLTIGSHCILVDFREIIKILTDKKE